MKIPKIVYIIFLPVLIFIVFFLIIKKDALIIELQNLSRSNYLPKVNKTFPKYGHSDDFSWVAGELAYYSLEGGCWTLHFEEDKSTQTEEYNGILALKIPSNLTTGLIDKKFDVVFCSDLKRAVQSAELTFKGTVPIISDKRLRECNYGDYNAKPSAIVEPMQEKNITNRFPSGESYEDVKTRIANFLEFLKKNYDGKLVAIVAHKAPQLALDVLLKGKTWEQAFAEDWRKKKAWQPGWEYIVK